MGHKIHPDIFRLGLSKDWQYQLKDPLLANVFIYKTVRKLFIQYSAPYVSYTIRRDVNPRKLNPYELKDRMINNLFEKNTLLFSHLNVSYAPSLLLAIFMLDGKAERMRGKARLREKAFAYHSSTFITESRRKYSFFRKNIYLVLKSYKPRKANKWRRYLQIFQDGFGLTATKNQQFFKDLIRVWKIRYPRNIRGKYLLKNAHIMYNLLESRTPYVFLPAWIIHNFRFFKRRFRLIKIRKHLRILCFLLRYFKHIPSQYSKRRLYFYQILFKSLTTCLYLFMFSNNTNRQRKKFKTIQNKLIHLQNILFLQLTKARFMYLKYNKKVLQSRLILFNLYAKILLFTMHKTTFIPTNRHLIIRFLALNNRNLSAQFLVNYIRLQLGQYFELKRIIQPIINRYKRQRHVHGFKFIITGRLTRKERAAYIVKGAKSMPLSKASVRIDYASDFKIMRFGVVGIKIYLLHSKRIPYYYFIEFRNKL